MMKAVDVETQVQRLKLPGVFPITRLDSNDAFCQECQKNANRSFRLEMRNEKTDQVGITSRI